MTITVIPGWPAGPNPESSNSVIPRVWIPDRRSAASGMTKNIEHYQ